LFCTPDVLKRALGNYQRYLPTASEHLREMREKWIPVHVRSRYARQWVLAISEQILAGTRVPPAVVWTPDWSAYNGLKEEYQIAVALCVMQGWAEHLQSLPSKSRSRGGNPLPITERVGQFLAGISLDHATLAIRNWSFRDGERGIHAMVLIQDGRVTKVPEFMRVYLNIRDRWHARGFDWDRRMREEAVLKAQLIRQVLQ
jgi:hypothetical protein